MLGAVVQAAGLVDDTVNVASRPQYYHLKTITGFYLDMLGLASVELVS